MELEQQTPSPSTARKKIVSIILGIVLVAGVFRLGYAAGNEGFIFSPKEFKLVNQNDQPQTVDYGLLWKALEAVNQKYIDRGGINQQEVLYGAIRGAVSAAGDEYTEFFDPKDLADFRTELEGSFDGIGAEVGKRDGNIVIVAPLDDSPAQRAGLLPQDVVVKVDNENVVDKSVDEVVSKIRGERGTKVTLTIFREGRTNTFDVTITRAKIEIKSVKLSYKEIQGKQVAVLELTRFGDDTKELFDQAVKELRSRNVAGLVLDLRSNPGGYLDMSVEIASDWVDKGQLIVKEEHSERDTTLFNSYGYGRLAQIKTVVLINGGSASAAEIVAGALKDNGNAQLIGEKSFGKGSVQELVALPHNTAVKVTVAKWITPSGKNLNNDGLNPDIEVKMTEEDFTNNRDPQLDRALEEVVK